MITTVESVIDEQGNIRCLEPIHSGTALQKMIEGLGGKLEAFYFAHGADDVFGICDLPDAASCIAAVLVVNASGAVHVSTTPVITPEEVDAGCKKLPEYRAPEV